MSRVDSTQHIQLNNSGYSSIKITNTSRSLVGRQLEKIGCVAQKAIDSIKRGAHASYRFIVDNRKVILITAGAVLSLAGLVIVGVFCTKKATQKMQSKQQSTQVTEDVFKTLDSKPATQLDLKIEKLNMFLLSNRNSMLHPWLFIKNGPYVQSCGCRRLSDKTCKVLFWVNLRESFFINEKIFTDKRPEKVQEIQKNIQDLVKTYIHPLAGDDKNIVITIRLAQQQFGVKQETTREILAKFEDGQWVFYNVFFK